MSNSGSSLMYSLPPETPASAERRQALMGDEKWLTVDSVAAYLGLTDPKAISRVLKFREQGKILGVWVNEERAFRFPVFQFHQGRVRPQMKPLLDLIADLLDGPESGWGQVEWFYARHALMDAKLPSEMMVFDPDRVLNVLERHIEDGPNACW